MKRNPMDQPGNNGSAGGLAPCRADFDAIYDRHKEFIFKYAFYLTRDRGEAEDLFQETWLRVVRNSAGIKTEPERLKPWLSTIVSNLYKDSLRRKKSRFRLLGAQVQPGSADRKSVV